ncbi:response regulator transcription factor [Aquimarina sp. ERC-38]|uniref:response regulator transcription factor n=1 Tax=Aquimarina sp. ERC-38 TaxID=2949996 RepID=UPI002245C99E|nr:response regulator transcription factor [Aquimarina sp. ERC-38]UZO79899.1 response regulator transcription factor [Aquimarina sp. ERC-38]
MSKSKAEKKPKEKGVIIVDDHILFAQSLETLVAKIEGFQVLATLKNGKEVKRYFLHKRKRPDIILLDIKMPLMNGIETMQWLQENYPQQVVLALSMEDDEETVIKMLSAGAKGYLLKDIHPVAFEHAMNTVLQHGFYYSDKIKDALRNVNNKNLDKEAVKSKLTEREFEFMHLACSDLTYVQIADEMGITAKTVENYRDSVYKKLNISSRIGLVVLCFKKNLIKL